MPRSWLVLAKSEQERRLLRASASAAGALQEAADGWLRRSSVCRCCRAGPPAGPPDKPGQGGSRPAWPSHCLILEPELLVVMAYSHGRGADAHVCIVFIIH